MTDRVMCCVMTWKLTLSVSMKSFKAEMLVVVAKFLKVLATYREIR
jgi:hypothetical protein